MRITRLAAQQSTNAAAPAKELASAVAAARPRGGPTLLLHRAERAPSAAADASRGNGAACGAPQGLWVGGSMRVPGLGWSLALQAVPVGCKAPMALLSTAANAGASTAWLKASEGWVARLLVASVGQAPLQI